MFKSLVALCCAFSISMSFAASADLHISGMKWPNGSAEGSYPVETFAQVADDENELSATGFNDLVEFIMPSPNQEDAGSCLYMATTGILEWWMAKLYPEVSMRADGPIDFSERYTMNLASTDEVKPLVKNWKTDTVLAFNKHKYAVQNKHYRYTKNWYSRNGEGSPVVERGSGEGHEFGTTYNWINELDQIRRGRIRTPTFKRNIVFEDPESNQWNTDVTPKDIVAQVKTALRANKAPVMVMYNHYGYWHAVMVVGYDDQRKTECKFTTDYTPYMLKKAKEYLEKASKTEDEALAKQLRGRAEKFTKHGNRAKKRFAEENGCSGQGVFYVRDSIYSDKDGPKYDYNTAVTGDEAPYAKNIIFKEYEWLEVLGNHVIQVFAE